MKNLFNRIGSAISALLFLTTTSVFAQSPVTSGHAIAHDGTILYFEVYGEGDKTLLLGMGTAQANIPEILPEELKRALKDAKNAYIDGLADDYRLVFFEYPGEPKMYTLTPGTVALDYLAVADAAGADHFAYAGFSIGCVTGMQLALRTDRLNALSCGGFPTIDGPYKDMLKVTRAMHQGPVTLYGQLHAHNPAFARSIVTLYEGLQTYNDRAIQGQLTMPRLSWIGDQDQVTLNAEKLTHLGQTVIKNRAELEKHGWDVIILPGRNHLDALMPAVQVPLIAKWLKDNY